MSRKKLIILYPILICAVLAASCLTGFAPDAGVYVDAEGGVVVDVLDLRSGRFYRVRYLIVIFKAWPYRET